MNTEAEQTDPAKQKRKTALLILTIVILVVAVIYGIYWVIHYGKHETTDNAYVQGNVVQITPQISGTVIAIDAHDTDFVRAGQRLIQLDNADTQVALEQARAQLAQTVREVRTLYANNATLKANVDLREAELVRAKNELMRTKDDLARRQSVAQIGAVSKEEVQHAKASFIVAQSAEVAANATVAAAKEQLASNKMLTEGIDIEQHPNVLQAAAKFREAFINAQRTTLLSPVTGYVARRSVQLGQRVQPGAPLMAVVPLDQLWVDANFKEVQLRKIRIGQPVTMISDIYGSNVTFHGTVVGLGSGTGAAFALLPAQNATGNWIKVVQRVPVRIQLDPKELAKHPLRIGLSMEVDAEVEAEVDAKLDTEKTTQTKQSTNEKSPGAVTTALTTSLTTALTTHSAMIDAEIKKIITANLASEKPKAK